MLAETFRWQDKQFDITRLVSDIRAGLLHPPMIELQEAFIEAYCDTYLEASPAEEESADSRPPLAMDYVYSSALTAADVSRPIILLHVGEDDGLISLREDAAEPDYVVGDGNHRLLAAKRLKMRVLAYVFSCEVCKRYMRNIEEVGGE